MNNSIHNFGDGKHNVFRVNTASSSVPTFGFSGKDTIATPIFTETSHKLSNSGGFIASASLQKMSSNDRFGVTPSLSNINQRMATNSSGCGLFTQQNNVQQNTDLNTAQKGYSFGAPSTLGNEEMKGSAPAFGSVLTGSNIFGQIENPTRAGSFSVMKDSLKLLEQTPGNVFNKSSASYQAALGSNQSNIVFRSKTKNVFETFGNSTTNVGGQMITGSSNVSAPTFGNFNSQANLSSSSSNVFGNQETGVFALSNLRKSTNAVFGRSHAGESKIVEGRKEDSTGPGKVIQKKHALRSRLSEGMNRVEVQNIPEHMNNEHCLRQHFSKFGSVMKIFKKSNNCAVVALNNACSARNAKENGCLIDTNCKPMVINLRAANSQRTVESAATATRNQEKFETHRHGGNKSLFQTSKKRGADECTAAGGNDDDDDGEGQVNAFKPRQSGKSDPPQTPPKFLDEPVQTIKSLSSSRSSSAEERYRILEQRDKIIRNATQKTSDLSTSEVIKGTCMDMCPEKERYMRECQRRLSIFEMVPGSDQPGHPPTVDHFRAVKEYSRSSADQEMPLPSELRPPHILSMTMEYLLTNIINKGSVGFWAEWYDFLWNRMRAIRKDITQQMLSDMTAAELVEKSARFHILCSELLCEEEAGVFDQKINSENLTKCLQTLKEMYNDLYVKHGIVCQNEAEFRSYMLLMNINNAGDILREAQQWRPEVRQSNNFRNSMQAYLSVTSNNYIKFFKLVKKASYLASCILHRYFNQVRSLAVTRMAKAFNSPASGYSISYPFHDLINHLGFESSEEASAFLGNYGLVVTNGQITSENKQGRVAEPEGASLPINRSHRLVGSKARSSLGEIVNGGPLLSVASYTPRNSFNEQGYLIADEVDAPVCNNQSASSGPDILRCQQISLEHRSYALPPVKEIRDNAETLRRKKLSDVNEAIREVCNVIVKEVTNEMVREVSENIIEDSHRFLLLAEMSGKALIRETVEECTRECSIEAIREQKMEKEELIDRLTNQTAVDIYEEVILTEIQDACMETINTAWLAETEMRKDNAIFSLVEDLINQVAFSESNAYCQQYYQSNVKGIRDRLEDLKTDGQRILMKTTWNHWMGATRQKQIDRALASTVNLHQSTSEVFRSMFPRSGQSEAQDAMISHDFLPLDRNFGVSLLRVDEILSRQEEIKSCLEAEEVKVMERRRLCWSPMEVFKMAEVSIGRDKGMVAAGSKIFWKLLISLPKDGFIFTHKKEIFTKWLARKFKISEDDRMPEDGENFCFVCTKSIIMPTDQDAECSRYGSLNVCIRSVTDGSTSASEFDILGASSIVFFVRDHSDTHSDLQVLELESHRLRSLLESKPSVPPLPLVIMGSTKGRNLTHARLAEMFRLNSLVDEQLISFYNVIMNDDMCVNDLETTRLLTECTDWLLQRSSQPPSLCTQSVVEFFEENINRFFTSPVLCNLKKRRENSLQDLPFSVLVDFYNDVVGWLVKIVTDDELKSVSWPPSEFCERYPDLPPTMWNNRNTLSQLERFLGRSIHLPEFPIDLEDDVRLPFEYVKVVVRDSSSPWKLTTKINSLSEIMESEAVSRRNKRKSLDCSSYPPPPSSLHRTSIVLTCIDFKLSEICDFKEEDLHLSGTHFTNKLKEEHAPSLDASSLYKASSPVRAAKNEEIFQSGLNGSCPEQFSNFNKKCQNIFNSEIEFALDKGISSLFDQLESEKEASEIFERYLEKVLDDGNDLAVKHKRAKLMTEDEKKSLEIENHPSNALPATLSNSCKVQDDIDYLNFKIEQERRASVLLDLRAKLLLS